MLKYSSLLPVSYLLELCKVFLSNQKLQRSTKTGYETLSKRLDTAFARWSILIVVFLHLFVHIQDTHIIIKRFVEF